VRLVLFQDVIQVSSVKPTFSWNVSFHTFLFYLLMKMYGRDLEQHQFFNLNMHAPIVLLSFELKLTGNKTELLLWACVVELTDFGASS
jgi:hypothetical protein